VQRFTNEARRFGKLRHPNLVRIHALGREQGVLYIASEFVPGRTLAWFLQSGQMEIDRALSIGADVASGLAEAHRHGVVHRDLKPENVMIREPDGVVKVLDFGIAKDLNATIAITRPGTYMGTPGYSAPEQVRGDPVDGRADLFSLGAILYELITGEPPFKGSGTTEILINTQSREPAPAHRLNREVTEPLMLLLRHMLRKNPKHRLASAQEVVEVIGRVRKGHPAGFPESEAAGLRGLLLRLLRR
jgi:serine/threonine-protein kinase